MKGLDMQSEMATFAREERVSLAELLADLRPDEWDRRSLCEGWTVREVAVHIVSYDAFGWRGLPKAFIRGGLRVDSVNAWAIAQYSDLNDEQVVDLVRKSETPKGLTSGMGCAIALTDGLIHQQDIRRALGRPRKIPADRLVAALDFALKAPTLPAKKNARGLNLAATDVAWSKGSGKEVSGPGESLLMAIAGRPDALADLSGEGVADLASRIG